VTPYFSERIKTPEIIYEINIYVCCTHATAYFMFVMMCAFLFYYVSRRHLKFKSGLKSKLVCKIVKDLKILNNSLFPRWPWAATQPPAQPASPYLFSPARPC
jgi:hypothetical protein